MPVETCQAIREQAPAIRRVGFMVTNGTYRSRLYEELLIEMGYEAVVPDAEFQEQVIHRIVYDPGMGVKAHPGGVTRQAKALMEKALCYFRERGAEALILGCTELSLVGVKSEEGGMLVIDSMDALALALIRAAEGAAAVDYERGSKMAIID